MNWIDYKPINSAVAGSSIYADTVQHCKDYKNFWAPGDKITSAHELTHGINNDIRNSVVREVPPLFGHYPVAARAFRLYAPISVGRQNAFYALKDRAIRIDEPSSKKHDCIQHIPESLRFYRFKTYVSGQEAWDDMPYYLFDEWTAYCNGAECGIEEKEGKGSDTLFGAVEFMTYCTATLMAAGELSPEIIEYTRYTLDRCKALYTHRDEYPWPDMDKCWNILSTGEDAAQIREFLRVKIGWSFYNQSLNWIM